MEDVEGTLAATVWILGAVFGLEVSLPTVPSLPLRPPKQ
jgi:hypothetical protein